jgi:hypothetical protein
MFLRSLVALALLAAPSAAQPDAGCTSELIALVQSGATTATDATCAALAAFEGCISRVEDRPTQSNLENELQSKQENLQDCVATPMTAAIRTERDAVAVTGRQVLFHRTIRQTVNVHELNEQVGYHQDNLTSMQGTIAELRRSVTSAMDQAGADAISLESRVTASLAASASTQTATLADELSSIRSTMAVQQDLLSTAVQSSVRSLNVSVQQALVAASNAASPQIYIQWGARRCTAAAGATVVKLYNGVMYGSRHNQRGSANNQCLKDANGAQGGHQQDGRESNDILVPLRKEHSNYNSLPSLNNVFRQRDGYNIPCAKCKYHKSCFLEVGVAGCPANYHQMYTGWMHGQHQSHHGNTDRVCLDKNPTIGEYNRNGYWAGHLYPTIIKDGSGAGSRTGNYVAACHMCCAH